MEVRCTARAMHRDCHTTPATATQASEHKARRLSLLRSGSLAIGSLSAAVRAVDAVIAKPNVGEPERLAAGGTVALDDLIGHRDHHRVMADNAITVTHVSA